MNIRVTLLALLGSAALSTQTFAAATGPKENHPADRMEMASRCAILESQFDDALASTRHGQAVDQAKALDSAGTAECSANEGDIGVVKLDDALMALGAKPSA